MEIYCVKEVEQNPLPKSQTKPFYIGTKEAPSEFVDKCYWSPTIYLIIQIFLLCERNSELEIL